jgi:uncharacterized protein YjbI with pentapeptide repeats
MTQLTEPLPQDLRNRSFRALNCEGWDFSGRDIRGCDFRNANLKGADFSHAIAGASLKQKVRNLSIAIALILGSIAAFVGSFAFIFAFVFAIVGTGVGIFQFLGVRINAIFIAALVASVIAIFDAIIFVLVGAIILSSVFEVRLSDLHRGFQNNCGTDFRNANLTDANFSHVILDHCRFIQDVKD